MMRVPLRGIVRPSYRNPVDWEKGAPETAFPREEDAEVSANYENAPYFFPFLYAKDLEFFAWDESSFETDFGYQETEFDIDETDFSRLASWLGAL
jgi:hypothetical protein